MTVSLSDKCQVLGTGEVAAHGDSPGGRPLHILHVLPDLALSGGQQVVLHNLERLDQHEFCSHVCYFRPVHDMQPMFSAAGTTPWYIPLRGPCLWPLVLRQLLKQIRRAQIDVVHIHGTPTDKFYGQLAALFGGLPVVRTLHGVKPSPRALRDVLRRPRPRQLVRWARDRWRRLLDPVLDRLTVREVIAVSDEVLHTWHGYLERLGISDDQITVNYNGVAVERYLAARKSDELPVARQELSLDDAFPVLVNVGRLSPAKGQDLLIEMMACLVKTRPRAKLLLVGEGDFRETLEQQIEAAGLDGRIELVGQSQDVPSLLALGDVFVFSSHFEGLPLSVLEAMATGLPVVACYLPGLAELVVDNVTGYLLRERDAGQLARNVEQLCADADSARRMGRAGQRLVQEKYDIGASVQRLAEVYRQVSTKRACKARVRKQTL